MIVTQKQRFIYNISQLTSEAKELLEGTFPLIWVEGEISNLSSPASGHWYFTLKDNRSQVRCAMFRMRNMHLNFRPKNGDQIVIRARVSLYTARGDFQLIAEHMEAAGDGALLKAFEELKQQLSKQGLFAESHKQTPPILPKHIGIITSASGAAVRDILHILKRRAPNIPVTIYPSAVQGDNAPAQLIEMLQTAIDDQRCDALILTRGGGSIEDLWAFNSEKLAHAIYHCPIPIISAVGHEIDYTISDFVADQRAPTPSAAAELISPDQQIYKQRLSQLQQQILRGIQKKIIHGQQQLAWLKARIRHPQQKLLEQSQYIDELERRITSRYQQIISQQKLKVAQLSSKILQNSPLYPLERNATHLKQLQQQLHSAIYTQLQNRQQNLQQQAHQLHAVSPLATLSRGYAIAKVPCKKQVILSSSQVDVGERIDIQLNKGRLTAMIEQIHEN